MCRLVGDLDGNYDGHVTSFSYLESHIVSSTLPVYFSSYGTTFYSCLSRGMTLITRSVENREFELFGGCSFGGGQTYVGCWD